MRTIRKCLSGFEKYLGGTVQERGLRARLVWSIVQSMRVTTPGNRTGEPGRVSRFPDAQDGQQDSTIMSDEA